MAVRWEEREMHGQAGAAAQQGMDPITAQQWAGMVCRSVTASGIGIGSAPGQDGSTIDNQITRSDQTATHGTPDGKYKKRLKGRGADALIGQLSGIRPTDARSRSR